MNNKKGDFVKEVETLKNSSLDYLSYIESFGNDCAYSDRIIERILENADNLKKVFSKRFENNKKSEDKELSK